MYTGMMIMTTTAYRDNTDDEGEEDHDIKRGNDAINDARILMVTQPRILMAIVLLVGATSYGIPF